MIDPLVTVMSFSQLHSNVQKFKEDLSKNLNNEKQLYKAFGFSRKKSISLESMQSNLTAPKTDKALTPESILYIAKLTQTNIVLCHWDDMERMDTVVSPEFEKWCVYSWDPKLEEYTVAAMKSIDEINSFIQEEGILHSKLDLKKFKIDDMTNAKVAELKTAYRFMTGNTKTPLSKAELVDKLEKLTRKP
jgi:hypothetical protein